MAHGNIKDLIRRNFATSENGHLGTEVRVRFESLENDIRSFLQVETSRTRLGRQTKRREAKAKTEERIRVAKLLRELATRLETR